MSPPRTLRHLPAFALVAVVLSGQVLDRTTRQPLVNVSVDAFATSGAANGRRAAHAVTDANGRFRLSGLHRGPFRIDLVSDDVPHATSAVTIGSDRPRPLQLFACSTTLDYSCAASGGGPPEPGS